MPSEPRTMVSSSEPCMRPGELIIRLKEAKGFRTRDCFCLGPGDVYVMFDVGGEKRKSQVRANRVGRSIQWDEEQVSIKIAPHVKFELYNHLHVTLVEDDNNSGDDPRGAAKIHIAALLPEHENEVPFRSYPMFRHGRQRGSVELAISFLDNVRTA